MCWRIVWYTCGHILGSCIAVCSHYSCRHVAFAIHRPVLGQPEIRKLRIVILLNRANHIRCAFLLQNSRMKHKIFPHTGSSKIFEDLKSRYITFAAGLWRYASPFAAPRATFIRRFQDNGWKYDVPIKSKHIWNHIKYTYHCNKRWINWMNMINNLLLKRWFSKLPRGMNS